MHDRVKSAVFRELILRMDTECYGVPRFTDRTDLTDGTDNGAEDRVRLSRELPVVRLFFLFLLEKSGSGAILTSMKQAELAPNKNYF